MVGFERPARLNGIAILSLGTCASAWDSEPDSMEATAAAPYATSPPQPMAVRCCTLIGFALRLAYATALIAKQRELSCAVALSIA